MTTLLPGDRLPINDTKQPAALPPGTHLHASHATSSLAAAFDAPSTLKPLATPPTPSIHAIVLLRILRITPRQANGIALTMNNVPCAPYPVIIRAQDVRATEKDKVKVADSFRPGDTVRAEVVSLGGAEGYYVSTARNELGVVAGRSEGGWELGALSWESMGDGWVKEARKVAKP